MDRNYSIIRTINSYTKNSLNIGIDKTGDRTPFHCHNRYFFYDNFLCYPKVYITDKKQSNQGVEIMENKTTNKRIDVRAAVFAAKNYLQSLQGLLEYQIKDLRLEEVELSEDRKYWLITLGFITTTVGAEESFFLKKERDYKVFKVNAETGEVESMKIREL